MPVPSFRRNMAQRYRLEAAKCTSCGKVFFPPRLICDKCKGETFEKITLKGKGKIVSYTIIYVPASPFADEAPFPVAIIEMDEGVRLMAQVGDCEFDELHTGMEVELVLRKLSEEGASGIIHYAYKAVPV